MRCLSPRVVIPTKAGIQNAMAARAKTTMDPRVRGDDGPHFRPCRKGLQSVNFLSYRCLAALFCVAALLVITGCRTTPKSGDSSGLVPASRIVFQPYVRQVAVQAGEGRYPGLFSGASYAIWGDSAAMTAEATPTVEEASGGASEGSMSKNEGITEVSEGSTAKAEGSSKSPDESMTTEATNVPRPGQPILVTCFLESQFSDMSIAYDAVGLRGVSIFLELPDGTQVLPAQKVLDSNLKEAQVGALRRFRRKITLFFPSRAIIVDNPAVTPTSRGVRLVLEAHETQFYFEWPARPDTRPTAKKPGPEKQALKATKAAYREFSSRAKRLSHELD
ncbi:MAG: hypothetical protein L3K26_04740 [Candidatus Hydrogenedentes bacterium]|nr:hypothetical protein [Candidatus Hydrogenedentota bacterium]